MLSIMRDSQYRYVFYGILALLFLGLIGFGVGGLGSGTVRSIGTVGSQDVPLINYYNALSVTISNAARFNTEALSSTYRNVLQRQVLDGVLLNAALDNEVARLGISVGDAMVVTAIRNESSYQGIDGQFDKEIYQYALERSGMSIRDNEAAIRRGEAQRLLQNAISGGVNFGAIQARYLLDYLQQRRDFNWVVLDESMLEASPPKPSAVELQNYYNNNQDSYTTKEIRKITFVWLRPRMLASQVKINKDELRQAYDTQPERFNIAAKRALDRIVFADTAEAEQALLRLNDEAIDFVGLGAERGLAAEDLSLGEVSAAEINSGVAEVLFANNDIGIFGPLDSDLGPALYRVNAVIPPQNISFEDAKQELRTEISNIRARRLVQNLVPEIDDQLAAGADLEDLAKETELRLGTIDFMDTSEDGIAAYFEFRAVAATLKKTDFPNIMDLSDGGIFAIRLDDIVPSRIKPIEKVQTQLKINWHREQVVNLLQKKADDIIEKLDQDSNFADFDLTPQLEENVNREDLQETLPSGLINAIFKINIGQSTHYAHNRNVFIGQLKAITETDLTEPENRATFEQIQQQITTQTRTDMIQSFAKSLLDKTKVSLNQTAINSINSQLMAGP